VGLIAWPGYQPFILARDLGFLGNEPIQIGEYPSNSQILSALRSGTLDVACTTMDEALLVAQDLPDIKIILVLDKSNGADAVISKPEIASLADLRGKRVGYEASALGAYMLNRMLEHAKLRTEDLKLVSVRVDQHESVFREGGVDAIVTFEPTRSRLLASGAKVLFDSTMLPGEIMDVLVARESSLKANPERINKLLSSWSKALKYMNDNRDDANKRLSAGLRLSLAEASSAYAGVRLADLEENKKLLSGSPPALLAPMRRLADVMLAGKLLSRPAQVEALVDPGPVARWKPE
jgi:NitT/TauT family transport system substrate-binding protein